VHFKKPILEGGVIAVSGNDHPGELIAYALPLAQPARCGQ